MRAKPVTTALLTIPCENGAWMAAVNDRLRNIGAAPRTGSALDSGSMWPTLLFPQRSALLALSCASSMVCRCATLSATGQSHRGQVVRCQGRTDMVGCKQRRCVPEADLGS